MKKQWIEVEEDMWVNPEGQICIELYSELDISRVVMIAGEVSKTKDFKTRLEALQFIENIIKQRNQTLTEVFK